MVSLYDFQPSLSVKINEAKINEKLEESEILFY